MRTKTLCTSCEQYVYTDADHSCHDAKALRAVRDAEAAVVEAAEDYDKWVQDAIDCDYGPGTIESHASWGLVHVKSEALRNAVRALHAARQGGA
jgi:hypothetical protein